MAFTLENIIWPNVVKNDPQYIKWIPRLYGKRDGVKFEKILPYHTCTEADLAEFSPIAPN